jgi:hypothetical protein
MQCFFPDVISPRELSVKERAARTRLCMPCTSAVVVVVGLEP